MAKHMTASSGVSIKVLRLILPVLILISVSAHSQTIINAGLDGSAGIGFRSFTLSDNSLITVSRSIPVFRFVVDNKEYNTGGANAKGESGRYEQIFADLMKVTFTVPAQNIGGWTGEIVFENTGSDTVVLSNVVPFGENISSVYITGYGPPDLARACLFRPGFRPLRVILPDNAWEMGYSSITVGDNLSVCAIARRQKTEGGQKRRYETVLPPKSTVSYLMHAEIYTGEWQNGLRLMFRDKYLYDLEKFDNTLYERSDLAWIRESYLIILQMAWDREFYDRQTGKYTYGDYLRKGIERFGFIDVFGIWPTWPRLGLDERNQWDLYRDLPGGTGQLRNFARMSRPYGTKFFIAYNPWDNSTRKEDHYKGMAKLIEETEADGVVLDTRGSSSYELQAAADSVRKGVVMFSEGMAITKDMPGIISGRVHNAIFYSPELNLNKLIKPDFSIFRVADVGEDIIHREIAIAFFNGYGTELNMFRPGGRDEHYDSDLDFLAQTTFILRQNNDAFLDVNWTPLIGTQVDDVFVNEWTSGSKKIFTVLNMRPEGFSGRLFKIKHSEEKHYVSLWNHENVIPENENGTEFISSRADGWLSIYSGTRREGSVDCIAEFPDLLRSNLHGDSIRIGSSGKGKVILWKGNPSYKSTSKELRIKNDTVLRVKDLLGFYEGKIVIQLVEGKILMDENVITLKGGKPWLITRKVTTKEAVNVPSDMVLVRGSAFSYNVTTGEDFIPYPDVSG
ncbi:MAG: sulfatase-modifying factor protein, partial [Bacteroidia bacterium]|nr:sulfatase-modifying factor protein [Bacteroidia bacterium]